MLLKIMIFTMNLQVRSLNQKILNVIRQILLDTYTSLLRYHLVLTKICRDTKLLRVLKLPQEETGFSTNCP